MNGRILRPGLAVVALGLLAVRSAGGSMVPERDETAVFAGGCFWGVEAVFRHVNGVKSAESGYAGGTVANPSYEQVSSGRTGHAESVRVVFDASRVSYSQLLGVFFTVAHDPTQRDRQGPDVGTQYRAAIFYVDDAQRQAALSYIDSLRGARKSRGAIVTQVVPLRAFYVAEDSHQDYLARHPDDPYIVYNDAPKLVALRNRFPELYRAAGESRSQRLH